MKTNLSHLALVLALAAPVLSSAEDTKYPNLRLAPPPETAAPAEVKKVEEKKDTTLLVESEKARMNLLIQTWGIMDPSSNAASAPNNNFRIRRAELKFSGNFDKDTKWFIMIDPAKNLTTGAVASTNDNKVLQDLGVGYTVADGWEIQLGQFKVPTVSEGLESSTDLPLPERSLMARTFGDKRSTGGSVSYKENKWKATVMASNGGSTNTTDVTNEKDLAGRVEVYPIDGLSVGAFTAATDGKFGENGKYGANIKWKEDLAFIRFELVNSDETVTAKKTKSKGFSTDFGFGVGSELQPVMRYEELLPNVDTGTRSKAWTLGANYLFKKNNKKLQFAYTSLTNLKGSLGSYAVDTTISHGRLFVLAFQLSF